jgi:hypothetical protein
MTSNSDELIIIECPKCGGSHKFALEVRRSYFVSYTAFGPQVPVKNKKPFTRFFTCPKTGDDFQVRFWMSEEPDAPIKSVSVKPLGTEPGDETKRTE